MGNKKVWTVQYSRCSSWWDAYLSCWFTIKTICMYFYGIFLLVAWILSSSMLTGLLLQIFTVSTTISLIHNMSPPKRASWWLFVTSASSACRNGYAALFTFVFSFSLFVQLLSCNMDFRDWEILFNTSMIVSLVIFPRPLLISFFEHQPLLNDHDDFSVLFRHGSSARDYSFLSSTCPS